MQRAELHQLVGASILVLLASACSSRHVEGTNAVDAMRRRSGCGQSRDLELVASCFYLEASREQQYDMLADQSQSEVSRSEWNLSGQTEGWQSVDRTMSSPRSCRPVAVSVVGEARTETSLIQSVQVEQHCSGEAEPAACTFRLTETWIRDGRTWQRLVLPQTAASAGALWNLGRYEDIPAAATDWLERDGLSIEARRLQAWALMRGVGQPDDAALRAAVSALEEVNPSDSQTKLIATSLAPDFASASAVLRSMHPNDCFITLVAANTALRAEAPADGLALLDELSLEVPRLVAIRVMLSHRLGKMDAVRAGLHSVQLAKFKEMLADEDPGFAQWWSSTLAHIAFDADETAISLDWLKLASEFGPSEDEVAP